MTTLRYIFLERGGFPQVFLTCYRRPPLRSPKSDQRPIVIVGASVRAAATSALRAGYAPWCADLFADADLASTCPVRVIAHYPHDLPKLIRQAPPGPWMFTGAMENSPEVIAEIATERELWGIGAEQLRRLRDPWQVADALQSVGLRTPELAHSPKGLPVDGSWLVKRRRSAGGQQIRHWNGVAQTERAETHFFQQCVAGDPCSAVYAAAGGLARLLGVTRQLIGEPWTGASGFRYAGSIGPLNLDPATTEKLTVMGRVLSAEFQLKGLFGVDFVLAKDQAWPIEVNPRYTASVEILERATGLQSIHWHALACRDDALPSLSELPSVSERQHGKAILFAERRYSVSPELTAELLAKNVGRAWPEIADIPAAESVIDPGWPVATVFAEGAKEAEVLGQLQLRVNELRNRLKSLESGTSREWTVGGDSVADGVDDCQ